MSPKKPTLPPDDAALWAFVVQDVTPMHAPVDAVDDTSEPAISAPVVKKTSRTHRLPQDGATKAYAPKGGAPESPIARDMDKNTRLKLERGKMDIESVLDLHGSTFEDAQSQIYAFLQNCWRAQMRCVLVITGKGRGVLKSGFERWVNEAPVRNIVLHAYPAQGRHGGGGAFYVLLRRKRGGL